MKTTTRARNRITSVGGWVIPCAAVGLSSGSPSRPHNAQSPSGQKSSTHHPRRAPYVHDEPTPPHLSPKATRRVLGASRQHHSLVSVRHHQPIPHTLRLCSPPPLPLKGVRSRVYPLPATGRRRPRMIGECTTRAANDASRAGATAFSLNRLSSPTPNPTTTYTPHLSAPP